MVRHITRCDDAHAVRMKLFPYSTYVSKCGAQLFLFIITIAHCYALLYVISKNFFLRQLRHCTLCISDW